MRKSLISLGLVAVLAAGCPDRARVTERRATESDSKQKITPEMREDIHRKMARIAYFDCAEILGSEEAVKHYPEVAYAVMSMRLNDASSRDIVNLRDIDLREIKDMSSFKECLEVAISLPNDCGISLRRTSSIVVDNSVLPYWRVNSGGEREYLLEQGEKNRRFVGFYAEFNPESQRVDEDGQVIDVTKWGEE